MRKAFISSLLPTIVLFIGCSPYGDKVEVNSKSEVYYKDGATKEEAQKLADFLLRLNFFDDQSERSVQMVKLKDTSVVKFVVNEEKLKNNPDLEAGFKDMHLLIKDSVFAGKPTKVLLTNDEFKEIKSVKEYTQEELNAVQPAQNSAPATPAKDQ